MANSTKIRASIKEFLTKMKAMDAAIPEELAEDALEMTEEVADALCETEDENELGDDKKEDDTKVLDNEEIEKKVTDAVNKALRNAGLVKDSAMKALDELEEKMDNEDADNEEAVTVDPEKINDSSVELKKYIQKMKPIIANIKDSKQRKIMSDSLAAMAKIQTSDQYADVLNITKKNASDNAKVKTTTDADYDYGQEIARKFNPHYNKEVK